MTKKSREGLEKLLPYLFLPYECGGNAYTKSERANVYVVMIVATLNEETNISVSTYYLCHGAIKNEM